MDDAAAIAQLKRGEIEGLRVLVTRYQMKALRTAYLIVQDHQRAEEIVQEAFIRVYQRIHQFDETRPFAPWFLRSVANAAVRTAQRDQRQISLHADFRWEEMMPDNGHGPEAAIEMKEQAETVRAALAQLTPELRAVIVLRYYLGHSTQEIASQTHSPIGTVKWRLYKARHALRSKLQHFKEQFNE